MKKLYVPGRVWLDVNSFVAEFPQTKLPLVILLGDSILKKGTFISGRQSYHEYDKYGEGSVQLVYTSGKRSLPLGIDQWTYDKKIETYRDIIRNVLSPEFPLTIKLQANPCLTSRDPNIGCQQDGGGLRFSFSVTCRPLAFTDGWEFHEFNLGWVMWYYMHGFPADMINNVIRAVSSVNFKNITSNSNLNNCRLVHKDQMIDDFTSRGFKYFEAKSYPEWKQYNEIYA